jgi:hypothetical protein
MGKHLFLTPNHKPPYNLRLGVPAYNDLLRPPELTDDEFLEWWIALLKERGDIPTNNPVYIVDEDNAPADHSCNANCEFFNAWEWRDGGARVNFPKARAIHLAEIRRVRNKELVKLDVPFMRAVEAGDTDAQTTIGAEKQVLRDIPATFDLTTDVDTPEKLKAKWPTELPARE